MELLAYLAAMLIGISLGMIGSGGSILTVPVLVYLLGVNPLLATTSSLFIVGTTSLAGGLRAYSKRLIDFKAVTEFGIPSILSIFLTRHFLLPELPSYFFNIGSLVVTKEIFLMLFFGLLMLAASISMINSRAEEKLKLLTKPGHHKKALPLILLGLLIGFITGLLGAGGGFLIIPTLVIFLKIPMRIAIGTSLLIIAINSLFGFLFTLKQFHYDWQMILSFTGLAIAGIFIGSKFSDRFAPSTLKKFLGWFVLVMGVFVIVKELLRG